MRALPHFTNDAISGGELKRTGNQDPGMAPSGIYRTADGRFLALAIGTDSQFRGFCRAAGREELISKAGCRSALERAVPEVAETLSGVAAEYVGALNEAEIIEAAAENGFPAAPVMDDMGIYSDEWRRRRGNVIEFQDTMYGRFVMQTPSTKLSLTPSRVKWLTRPLGYHNRYVFKKILGLSEERITQLEKTQAVGYWDYRVGQRPPVYYDLENDPIFNYRGEE
jgi:crotonobetainyl-CoA:carnitine CoA-transferase CaiB-like acyl-CoA transferase